jgi:hypothetical protein
MTPTNFFQLAFLTLFCLKWGDSVPTPTERPRLVSDVIADVTPQGHAIWDRRLMLHTTDDLSYGLRPLPWLTPSLSHAEGIISWFSSGNVHSIRHNKTVSFCPGGIIDGILQPFVVGAGEITSPLCSSLTLSIACPRVFHSALHTGSNSPKGFGLHTFPKVISNSLRRRMAPLGSPPYVFRPRPWLDLR